MCSELTSALVAGRPVTSWSPPGHRHASKARFEVAGNLNHYLVAGLTGFAGGFHAKSFFNVVVAATMASLFVVIFWVAQVGAAATAAAAVKTETNGLMRTCRYSCLSSPTEATRSCFLTRN